MSDFGAELARWMQARGLGVRELHRRSGYSAGYVTQLRQGRRTPSLVAACDLDDALGAGGALAECVPLRERGRVEQLAADPARPSQPSSGGLRSSGHEPVTDRRAAGVIAAIGEALHAAPECGPGPERHQAELEQDVLRAWQLRQSAEYARLGRLLTGLLRDVACGGANAGVSVHVCNMTSSLLKRLGAFEMAAVAADRAFRSASQAENPLLVSAAKLRVANVYLAASRHPEAVAVAAAAADGLPPRAASAPQEVAAFGALLLTAAVAAAKLGEAAQAWEFLGHARAAAAICDREHASLYAVFGPVNLAVHGVQVATELGDGREALRRAELTDPGRMPAALLERRSTLLIDIARAQHIQRDQAGAAKTLIEAERVAPLEVRYSGAARGLLVDLLGASGRSPALRDMAARLSVAA
jgi:transcriptional regulator with XRE-family HTH domain